jgi:cyanophycin synthetase
VIRRFPLDRGPYVVKPAKGTGSGVGVSVGVRSRLELANAIALASVHSSRIIIERLVAAETVRLLFLDGRMIHAVRRRGVRVETDGITSIEQLVARLTPRPVPIDAVVRETIHQQGRSLADVLPAGEELVVRWLPAAIGSSRELRTIYDEEVTNLVSPALVEEVAPLLAALGSRFAGVDLLTNDPTRSLAEAGGVFLEINTTPGLHHHCTPSADGVACDVAVTVLRRLLDRDA